MDEEFCNFIGVKDPNHKICRESLVGVKCEFCEVIFDDLINKKGLYLKLENPQELIFDEDIEEHGKAKAIRLAKKEFIQDAEGFARAAPLCRKHFRILRKDNKKRNIQGIEIKANFDLLNLRKSDI